MKFKFADLIFFFAAFFLSIVFIFHNTESKKKHLVLIYNDNQMTIPFSDNLLNLKKITGKNMILNIKDGKVNMESSDCRDKICIKTGVIENCGDMIVCMPNAVAVKIDCLVSDEN